MQWLSLRRFRGAQISSDLEAANFQHDRPFVENTAPVSLLQVLWLLNLLVTDESRFTNREKNRMSEEKEVLTTVMHGVQVLIKRGFDYSAETQALSHFSRRLRDLAYRSRSGPQLLSMKAANELETRHSLLADEALDVDDRLKEFSDEELQNLMTVLSSSLVFKNYNRSIRILHCFFSSRRASKSSAETSTMDWLIRDLYSITDMEVISTEDESQQFTRYMLELYMEANDSLENIKSKTLPIYESLEPIQAHPEGGRLRSKRRYVLLSRAYVIAVLAFSCVVAILNFANRDNVFERIFDAIQVSTLLLVSIFGLVKLTSEDPNVIRNNFLGYRVVRSARDVVRAWGLESEDEVKKVLALSKSPQEWLDKEGTCYVVAGRGRGVMLSYGIGTRLLYEVGCDFEDNRFFRGDDTKGYFVVIESSELETVHIKENDVKHLFPTLSTWKSKISVVDTMNCK